MGERRDEGVIGGIEVCQFPPRAANAWSSPDIRRDEESTLRLIASGVHLKIAIAARLSYINLGILCIAGAKLIYSY